jgi:hypothetical protein
MKNFLTEGKKQLFGISEHLLFNNNANVNFSAIPDYNKKNQHLFGRGAD